MTSSSTPHTHRSDLSGHEGQNGDAQPRGDQGSLEPNEAALRELSRETGAAACLHHKCSAGCPGAADMDLLPSQLVRLLQLGDEATLLRARSIWLCMSCRTCTTRCPAGVDLAAVQDRLRRRCLAAGIEPAEPRIAAAHDALLRSVQRAGRVSEAEVAARFKLRCGGMLEDLQLGLALLGRGRLGFRPYRVKARKRLRPVIHRLRRPSKERA